MFTRSQVPGRTKGKMAVDILMTAVLLGLMTYSFIGEKAHERLGMAMFFCSFCISFSTVPGFWDLAGGNIPPTGSSRPWSRSWSSQPWSALWSAGSWSPSIFFLDGHSGMFMRQPLWLIFSARIGVLYWWAPISAFTGEWYRESWKAGWVRSFRRSFNGSCAFLRRGSWFMALMRFFITDIHHTCF